MPGQRGLQKVVGRYRGTQKVTKRYRGTQLVWSSSNWFPNASGDVARLSGVASQFIPIASWTAERPGSVNASIDGFSWAQPTSSSNRRIYIYLNSTIILMSPDEGTQLYAQNITVAPGDVIHFYALSASNTATFRNVTAGRWMVSSNEPIPSGIGLLKYSPSMWFKFSSGALLKDEMSGANLIVDTAGRIQSVDNAAKFDPRKSTPAYAPYGSSPDAFTVSVNFAGKADSSARLMFSRGNYVESGSTCFWVGMSSPSTVYWGFRIGGTDLANTNFVSGAIQSWGNLTVRVWQAGTKVYVVFYQNGVVINAPPSIEVGSRRLAFDQERLYIGSNGAGQNLWEDSLDDLVWINRLISHEEALELGSLPRTA